MKRAILIGIAGGSGAGKTTFLEGILERVGEERVAYVHHDSYYRDLSHLSPTERDKVNFDHPDALETDLLIEHLKRLQGGEAVDMPVYNFTTHTRRPETRRLEPKPVILLEGILILYDKALREMMDIKIYVDTDVDLRLIRRLKRDTEERSRTMQSVIDQYEKTVRPMHIAFVEPSKRYANFIIPEGGFDTIPIDTIVARIEKMLEEIGTE